MQPRERVRSVITNPWLQETLNQCHQLHVIQAVTMPWQWHPDNDISDLWSHTAWQLPCLSCTIFSCAFYESIVLFMRVVYIWPTSVNRLAHKLGIVEAQLKLVSQSLDKSTCICANASSLWQHIFRAGSSMWEVVYKKSWAHNFEHCCIFFPPWTLALAFSPN